ncbi:poly-gamma-glutamate hydrolase family protein [Halobacterium sp. R2-5]|uniref:poly-gamma-glutamate hydrolase family protein n=1 Tax=Halobacterium sp. R2-5 TaxID=2715751 RepID=UPI00141F9303|nr:poly-gamma-glutamate hydrolase family protein [Halobacterium sp. R2-5]NIC01008.1 hypothetical protein [Halobacterium sp. R2-5]
MHEFSRRTVLSGVASIALGTGVGAANGKPGRGRDKNGSGVRIKTTDDVSDIERCRLPRSTMDAVGVEPGHQIRLVYDGASAVFTASVSDDKFGYVNSGGRDRLGASGGSFCVDTDSNVVNPTLDVGTAAEDGGFLERLTDPGTAELVALAPHGGYIEWGTDSQAKRISEQLDSVSWYGAGWWPGGGAYRRWHITSTDIHPASFPALDEISNRGFEYAVSFHGWSESHVGVGGAAPAELREAVRDAIAPVVDSDVRLASDGGRDGDSPENIVNWMTESGSGGVQIEQPWSVRDEKHLEVADAVAEVFDSW